MIDSSWEARFVAQWTPFRRILETRLHDAIRRSGDSRYAADLVWSERSGVWGNPSHQAGAWLTNLENDHADLAAQVREEFSSFHFQVDLHRKTSHSDLPGPLRNPNVLVWGATGAVFLGMRVAGIPLPVAAVSGAATAVLGKRLAPGNEPVPIEPFLDEIDALGDRIRDILRVADAAA